MLWFWAILIFEFVVYVLFATNLCGIDREMRLLSMFFFISDGNPDIIEETIYFFKANVFFKSYEIKVFI